jgi:hypothetical protein
LDKLNSEDPRSDSEAKAEELTRLAEASDDPAARAWYLQWANAFQRLSRLGAWNTDPAKPPRGDN